MTASKFTTAACLCADIATAQKGAVPLGEQLAYWTRLLRHATQCWQRANSAGESYAWFQATEACSKRREEVRRLIDVERFAAFHASKAQAA